MTLSELRIAWQALMPPGVAVEIMEYSADARAVGADEQAAAELMGLERRVEFLSGRSCARRALTALGVAAAGLPMAQDRGAAWPAGIVGSITHTESTDGRWVVAAVARSSALSAIGIDLERCELMDPRVGELMLAPEEANRLRRMAKPAGRDELSRIWCAKEAVIKAARGVTEPARIEVMFADAGEEFWARKAAGPDASSEPDWEFRGRTRIFKGYALAVAYR